jgi:hypothetical protein
MLLKSTWCSTSNSLTITSVDIVIVRTVKLSSRSELLYILLLYFLSKEHTDGTSSLFIFYVFWVHRLTSLLESCVRQKLNCLYPAFQVFISVSVILGDGIYNLIKIIYATIKEIMNARLKQGRLPLVRVQDGNVLVILCLPTRIS